MQKTPHKTQKKHPTKRHKTKKQNANKIKTRSFLSQLGDFFFGKVPNWTRSYM
jgi:hypothetical protein